MILANSNPFLFNKIEVGIPLNPNFLDIVIGEPKNKSKLFISKSLKILKLFSNLLDQY